MSLFLQHLQKLAPKFEAAVPAGFGDSLQSKRIIEGLQMAFAKNKALGRCDPASVRTAVLHSLSLGLDPSGLTGEAHLVPRGNQCTLLLSFKGKLALARRTNVVHNIRVGVVYENDDYSFNIATGDYSHSVRFGDRGKPVAAYAMADLDGSDKPCFAFITYDEWYTQLARGSKSPAYKNWGMEMFKKTALNRLLKMLPSSAFTMQTSLVEKTHEYAVLSSGAQILVDDDGAPMIVEQPDVGQPSAKHEVEQPKVKAQPEQSDDDLGWA